MLIAQNLFLGIPPRAAERTALMGPPSSASAVDSQTDPAAIIKGFVALGTAEEGEQSLPRRAGIEPLGEIAQGIVGKRSRDGEPSSSRKAQSRPCGGIWGCGRPSPGSCRYRRSRRRRVT